MTNTLEWRPVASRFDPFQVARVFGTGASWARRAQRQAVAERRAEVDAFAQWQATFRAVAEPIIRQQQAAEGS